MPTLTNIFSTYCHTNDNEEENDIFFFHSDHLGSTAYMTNKDGEACQFISYMPYGEALVSENNTDFENLFKFSGMELDKVTNVEVYSKTKVKSNGQIVSDGIWKSKMYINEEEK